MERECLLVAVFAAALAPAPWAGAASGDAPSGPVILSYGPPSPAGAPEDYGEPGLGCVNIVELGPRRSSYPPAEAGDMDPEVLDRLHAAGRKAVRRCYVLRFDGKGRKEGFCTLDELVAAWSDAMEEPGVDGICIDEFHSHDPFVETWMKSFNQTLFETWTEALRRVRGKYPGKLIMVWMWGWGKHSGPVLEAIRDYADYFMPEIYFSESDAPGFPGFRFTRYRESVDLFERLAPGISGKTLIGFGCHEKLWDTVDSIDYGDFLEAQLNAIVSDPVLLGLPGLALYKPSGLSEANFRRLDALLGDYCGKKKASGR